MITKRRAKRAPKAMHERVPPETETRANLSPLPRMRRMMMTNSKLSRTLTSREDLIERETHSRVTVTKMMAGMQPEVGPEAAEVAEVAEVDSSRTLDVVEQLQKAQIEKYLHFD